MRTIVEPIETILSDSVLDRAEKVLGLTTPDPKVRGELQFVCRTYLENVAGPPKPRRQDVVKKLQDIEKAARDLSGLLNEGYWSLSRIADEAVFLLCVMSRQRIDLTDIGHWADELKGLAGIASRARKTVPYERGGRPVDMEFHLLVIKLMTLFEFVTKKRAGITWKPVTKRYGGKFFTFVSVIERALAPATGRPRRSHKALGKFLRKSTRRTPAKGSLVKGQNRCPPEAG